MNRILVLPDIHLKFDRAERIIAAEGADSVICLGDVFDDFGDTPEQNKAAAEWLKNSLNKKNRIHLMGNHDLHYAKPNAFTICSGFTWEKHEVISTVLTKADWRKLRWFHLHKNFLFAHAGLTKQLFDGSVNWDLWRFLKRETTEANKALEKGNTHWVFRAGYSRGGSTPFGGLTWCDWGEFTPLDGIRQICGHTPGLGVRMKGDNICLDTHLNHYLIVKGRAVEIKSYADL